MFFIFFNNSSAQKKYYELFAIKYPPCKEKILLLVEPDTIKIFKDSLIGNYYINLTIKIINNSDSILLLKKPELDGCWTGPSMMEDGLYDFPKGISKSIFDEEDSVVKYQGYMASKTIDGGFKKYKEKVEQELSELEKGIAKYGSISLAENEKIKDVSLKPNEGYSFKKNLYLHTYYESNLSLAEDYYELEKNKIYSLIVYYSNEEYSFAKKDNLEYCAISNTVTLIVE